MSNSGKFCAKVTTTIDYRYFWIVPGKHPDEYNLSPKSKDETAVAVVSNCQPDRLNFVDELQRYVTVHVYGSCGDYSCHSGEDCFSMLKNRYKFYLAFENSVCKDCYGEVLLQFPPAQYASCCNQWGQLQ